MTAEDEDEDADFEAKLEKKSAKIAGLAEALQSTSDELQEAQAKIRELQRKLDKAKDDNPVNQAKKGMRKVMKLGKKKHKK